MSERPTWKKRIVDTIPWPILRILGDLSKTYTPGWQKDFPLPGCLDDPLFHRWARSLDKDSRGKIRVDLQKWEWARTGATAEDMARLIEGNKGNVPNVSPSQTNMEMEFVEWVKKLKDQELGE